MKIRIGHLLMFLVSMIFLSSCGVGKYIPEDKTLYDGPNLEFSEEVEVVEQKKLEANIYESLYPLPNRKFLGLVRFNLWVYFAFDKKQDKWIYEKIYNRFAEEPIYSEEIDIPLMEKIIEKKLQDHGHFKSQITGHVDTDSKLSKISYEVEPSKPTIVTSMSRPKGNSEIDSILANYSRLQIKEGRTYKLLEFEIERLELAKYIRSKGYYDFGAEDIFYLVDTANVDKEVRISQRYKLPEDDSVYRKFFIRNINVYTTSGSQGSGSKEAAKTNYQYQGLNVYEDFHFINKKALSRNILIEKGDLFSSSDYNLTLNRLLELNIFKYVNLQYAKSAQDSLDVDILLTPNLYLGVQYDLEASTSDRSFFGSSVVASISNDNTFKRAEKLTAAVRAGTEFQYIKSIPRLSILNANIGVKYEIPRLLVPFKIEKLRSASLPKTFLGVDEDYELWLENYTKNSTNIKFGYEWQGNSRINHIFEPIFFSLVNVSRTTAKFDSTLIANPILQLSYQDVLLIGTQFTISYDTKKYNRQRNHSFYRLSLETSGNTVSAAGIKQISNVPVSQYFKADLEVRLIRDFNPKEAWVTRFNVGVVKAYGNSLAAPFTRQFFIGGSTTLRGFQYGSVGPGRYVSTATDGSVNPIDQAGDLKFLLNSEYRFPLFSVFRGAFFIDAGNVWSINQNETRPESQFDWNKFYQELALNSGLGIRMDIDYIAFRFDFGIPMYSPFEAERERWIFQRSTPSVFSWARQNIVFSAGIGYPF